MAWQTQARLSQFCLRTIWVSLVLVCFFAVCESERAGRSKRNANNVFTEPGIIIGIIVGVLGVLVVLGVSLLLCRLFCCKNQSCCSCCGERDVYQEAGTAPIKLASESSPPDHRPGPTSQPPDRPSRFKPRKTESASPPTPPQYDDLSHLSPDFTDLRQTASKQDLDKDRRPDLLPHVNDDDSSMKFAAAAKLRDTEDTMTQGLQSENCELDDPHLRPNEKGLRSQSHFEPKKKQHHEKTRRGKEFPHKLRKRAMKPSQEDDRNPVSEIRSNEAREFPLLEIEPRKRNISPPYSNSMHDSWEDSMLSSADRQELMPTANRNQRLQTDMHFSSEKQEFAPAGNQRRMVQTDTQYSPNRHDFMPEGNTSQRHQTDTGYSPDRQDFTPSANWAQRLHSDMHYSLNREELTIAVNRDQINNQYSPDRGRTWENERRPMKHPSTDTPPPQYPTYPDYHSARHGTVQANANLGRINHSFNPDSTETTV